MLALAVLVAGMAIAKAATMQLRSMGWQPSFYQETFAPAVMMACGRGYAGTPAAVAPGPLSDFLRLRRPALTCGDLPSDLAVVPIPDGSWYYLHGSAGLLWRVAGISWPVLDNLAAVLGGITSVSVYGLFRLVSVSWLAAALALVFTITPRHLEHILHLRDYSKGPFALSALLLLAILMVCRTSVAVTFALAAAFGAVVGLGYGFRTDLLVMVPLGVVCAGLLLPGSLRSHLRRNAAAAVILLASFAAAAAPVIARSPTTGCAPNFVLLGLTTPLGQNLGIVPGSYAWGRTFSDTFVDLKVGDYAHREFAAAAPLLCEPAYEQIAGRLLSEVMWTFPADFVTRAYASARIILNSMPAVGDLGAAISVLAIAAVFGLSIRLGLALAFCVLLLCGYPAIEFQARHWFHLRFIPWWAALMVIGEIVRRHAWTPARLRQAALSVGVLLGAMALALVGLRQLQARQVEALAMRYDAAAREPIAVARREPSAVDVAWHPDDYGAPPHHRSSDLLKVTLDPRACADDADLQLRARYVADVPSHDQTSTLTVRRLPGGLLPAHLYVPVFSLGLDQTVYLHFTGFDVLGGPAACVSGVSRVTEPSLPLWVELHGPPVVAPYQTLNGPRLW